jgi:uncharacterized protein (TIGR02145 family)
MKETGTAHWQAPNEGATNESGFSCLPGGSRYLGGKFIFIGTIGLWWSSTEYSTTYAWYRTLRYGYPSVARGNYFKGHGFSVRCVRDFYRTK